MGELLIVGLGPGGRAGMTEEAYEALDRSEVIVGYPVYLDQIRADFPGKRYLDTPMRQEEKRCRMAIEEALSGYTVSLVCSGDAGVYGMAGLALELSEEYPPLEVRVISGVTAACSGAAVLGAPLMHDFAVISLSDLLTPWELIEKRLLCAAEADFSICLYNPSSKKRKDYLKRACEIILSRRSGNTVCGIVRQIGRDGESKRILLLSELQDTEVDMFTTVFIGNSKTKQIGEFMVTPRGYRIGKES
ncbi:precorrin-3B C(17)-methyltransferase [Massiliimalia massiliensis]|uniref:precorrin-3B C(17)-methyltransferase n=1 Tax=Massiliimalia massiliensis TaxID=1852384 RepID=UPI000986AEE2|nr:precorrin-3B C(17)-methyltransferase [Massiliimalia massiliensis]MBS1473912.1 precorrin-3B C(17)-methyltransferase [Massiliimalia sp.]